MRFPEKLSLVIPVYNEENRLPNSLKVCKDRQKQFPNWQFIFVDDGSTDKTKLLIERAGFKVISYPKNQGKGFALKQGVKKASKPLTLIVDVDFSTPLSELAKLYQPIQGGYKIVIGSRKTKGAVILKHQSILREWLGKQFTNLSKIWLGLRVSDVTCGFKLFKTKVAKQIFGKSIIKGWGYDAEILFLAKKYQIKIAEGAVTWKNDERTKVSMASDIVGTLRDLWQIRWNDLVGKYSG